MRRLGLGILIQDLGNISFCDILMEIIVNEADRCGTATGKALDKLDAEFAIGAAGRSMMMPLCGRSNSGSLAEGFLEFIATGQGTGKSAADADDGLAGSLLTEPGIKGKQLKNVNRFEFETFGNPGDPALINKSEMVLPEMKQRKRSASFGNRIVGYSLINLGQKICWNLVSLLGGGGKCWMLVHEALKEIKKRPFRKEGNRLLSQEELRSKRFLEAEEMIKSLKTCKIDGF